MGFKGLMSNVIGVGDATLFLGISNPKSYDTVSHLPRKLIYAKDSGSKSRFIALQLDTMSQNQIYSRHDMSSNTLL